MSEPTGMDDRTLTALRGSIAKWEAIVAGKRSNRGAEDCPLCELFINNNCKGCPVSSRSGHKYCFSTPYEEYIGRPLGEASRVKYGTAMVAFLRSLLPEGEEP